MTSTAATTHLQYLIDSWPHLTDMLDTRHGTTWPPAGRMRDHQADLDQADMLLLTPEEIATRRAAYRAAERADSRYTLGESPAPLRLGIVDVMRAVETDLVYAADVLATEVQRPPMAKAPTNWLPADRALRDQLAAEDAADVRRWRYPGYRSALTGAEWLLARVESRPGPFLRLTGAQFARVEAIAKGAARRIAQALNEVQHVELVGRPCPLCTGPLVVASGDGEQPVVTCFGCRQEWTLPLAEVA